MTSPTSNPAAGAGQPARPAPPGPTPAPYGIEQVRVASALGASDLEALLAGLPEEVVGLPKRQTSTAGSTATAVYAIDKGVAIPRFGMIVAATVPPATDAKTAIEALATARWGNPELRRPLAHGPGNASTGEPAYLEFVRAFMPGQFLIPGKPVFFLLWQRPGDDVAFQIVGDLPGVVEGLARACAAHLRAE
jgi:hypothetical protein